MQFLDVDGTVQPRITGHGDFIRQDTDFNRLPNFVAAVINRIYHCFLQRRIGHIEKAVGFRSVAVFHHPFLNHGVFQKCQRVFEDHVQWAGECFLRKSVATRAIGKLHHINLRLRKKLLWCRVEKHQADIQRVHRFGGAIGNSHLATQLGKLHRAGIGQQAAAHLAQKILNQRKLEVVQRGAVMNAVVERNRGCQADQLDFLFMFGSDGGRTFANVVGEFAVVFCQ